MQQHVHVRVDSWACMYGCQMVSTGGLRNKLSGCMYMNNHVHSAPQLKRKKRTGGGRVEAGVSVGGKCSVWLVGTGVRTVEGGGGGGGGGCLVGCQWVGRQVAVLAGGALPLW